MLATGLELTHPAAGATKQTSILIVDEELNFGSWS